MSERTERLAMFLRAKYPVHFYPGHPTDMLPRTDGEAVEFSIQDAGAILEIAGSGTSASAPRDYTSAGEIATGRLRNALQIICYPLGPDEADLAVAARLIREAVADLEQGKPR